jgi:RNase adaptor protein for sRNA GlmZ degradation
LPAIDCRHLPEVYDYLARQDGKSSAVKRVLLTDEVRDFSASAADRVFDALVQAIADGHGHGLPLRMTINIGSEQGRHRSVIVVEEAGKELRKRLRNNRDSIITADVSVGTAHQDLDRRYQKPAAHWGKHGDPDDEW